MNFSLNKLIGVESLLNRTITSPGAIGSRLFVGNTITAAAGPVYGNQVPEVHSSHPLTSINATSSRLSGHGSLCNELNSRPHHGDTTAANTAPAVPVYGNGDYQVPMVPSFLTSINIPPSRQHHRYTVMIIRFSWLPLAH